jgi:bacterioferritin
MKTSTDTKSAREKRRLAVIEVLNQARAMELQAIHQYMNQHYGLDDKDFGELAAQVKLIAIDEMRHAELFAERIEELDGEPTAGLSGPVEKGQAVKRIFPFDAQLEQDTIDAYNGFVLACRENGDSTTMKLFELVIDEEQVHFNYFDNVNDHIEELGEAYLAQKAGTPSTTGLNTQGFVARSAGTAGA